MFIKFSKSDLDVLWDKCLKGITPFNEQYCKPVLEKWNQLLAVQHLNSVDAYGVFNNELTEEFIDGGTTPGILTSVEISWHNMGHHFGHWPVNLEHWWVVNENSGEPNYHATTALWPEMVTHTSSCGVESWYENKWESHYKTNEVGRKYREWVSLIGLSEPNDYEGMRNNTAAWLKPGNVRLLNQNCVFTGVNYREKVLEFEAVGNGQCCFSIKPEISMVNPCIRIKKRDSIPSSISIDGFELKKEVDFEAEVVMGDILIWIKKTFKNEAVIKIL